MANPLHRHLGDQVRNLRAAGKTYHQIADILSCSTGVVSYYINPNGKTLSRARNRKYSKKLHPYHSKYTAFIYSKYSNRTFKKLSRLPRAIMVEKLVEFRSKGINNMIKFTVDDVIKKFGNNPICYLTGKEIDIYKSRSYSFDHIIPVSRGGDNSLDNLGVCTRTVNQAKYDMTPDEFINLCKQVLEHNGYDVNKKDS